MPGGPRGDHPARAWCFAGGAGRSGGLSVRANPDDWEPPLLHTDVMGPSVLVVDDHAGFRAVARTLLESEGFSVIGEASTGAGAVDAATRLHPNLVLLDVHLPDVDGFTVCKRLAKLSPAPVVVLTSSRPISDLRLQLAASVAAGFVPKDELSGSALLAFTG